MNSTPFTGKSQQTRIKQKDVPDLEVIFKELKSKRKDILSKADAIGYLIELGKEKLNLLK